MFLNGNAIPTPGPRGERIVDDTFYLILHAGAEPLAFTLPPAHWGERWETVLDTARPEAPEPARFGPGEAVAAEGRSVVVLRRLDAEEVGK